jgi:hypothetical protein
MNPEHRDVLTEAPPRERAACARLLLALGWAPARILSEVPHLNPSLVEGCDAEIRDVRPVSPRRVSGTGN